MAATDTVTGRIERARYDLSARDIALGLALAAGLLFVLALVQDPMVHDSLHNFRHASGITCH
jgi:cobalt transporter subunit CbtB